jgi:hypothetical protein
LLCWLCSSSSYRLSGGLRGTLDLARKNGTLLLGYSYRNDTGISVEISPRFLMTLQVAGAYTSFLDALYVSSRMGFLSALLCQPTGDGARVITATRERYRGKANSVRAIRIVRSLYGVAYFFALPFINRLEY